MEREKSDVVLGRPRGFDADQALEQAMQLFWEKGYEGTSLTDLTGAMGINRPSLYAAFGNKESLFAKALERYYRGPGSQMLSALAEPTARAAVERLLTASVDLLTSPCTPHGCLAVQGALACSAEAESVRQQLILCRKTGQNAIRERLERARAEGDLPANADCADLARYITTINEGMSVQAAAGATKEELLRVVQTALRAWPA